jgi:aerobic carbon-monoxide dehydrogenase large subunit
MVNPMIVEGQIGGGVVQGIGTAPSKRSPITKPVTGPSADYLRPGAAELPANKIGHLHTPAAAT